MKKNEKNELLKSKGSISSIRWAMVVSLKWSIFLAVISVVGYFTLKFLGRDIESDIFGGVALLISPILGFTVTGKTTQSFSESKTTDNSSLTTSTSSSTTLEKDINNQPFEFEGK